MRMTDVFAAQLDREAAICRRMLARVPEGRPEWKPHEQSMPLGYLASLVASMPSWIAMAIEMDELDCNPPAAARRGRHSRGTRPSSRRPSSATWPAASGPWPPPMTRTS